MNLPGSSLVTRGQADLERDEETIYSLLVSIGAPRLRALGVHLRTTFDQPEHRLYHALAAENAATAHSRYNALIRRLTSFERSLVCAS